MAGVRLFTRSVRRAAALWPLAVALYLPGVLGSSVAAIPVYQAVRDAPVDWTRDLANGYQLNALVEILVTSIATAQGQWPADANVVARLRFLGLGVIAALSAVLVEGVAYTILSGGVLSRLSGRVPGFWQSCWSLAPAMARYGLLTLVVYPVVGGGGLLLLYFGLPGPGLEALGWKGPLAAAWLMWLNGLLEIGRADLVAHDHRAALRAMATAIGAAIRPSVLVTAAPCWILLALLALLHAVGSGLVLAEPVAPLAATFAAAQLLALTGAGLKLARLAAALDLARLARYAIWHAPCQGRATAIYPGGDRPMAHAPNLVQVFNVQCFMCGRAAGQLLDGAFLPRQDVRMPHMTNEGARCGECGGNIYLEPDESITPFLAGQLVADQAEGAIQLASAA